MTKIVGVRFKTVGKMYYFAPMGFDIKRGDNVIVETSRGMEYGEVVVGIKEVNDSAVVKPLKGVLRLATEEDTARFKENKEKEKKAYSVCVEKIEKHGLDMKLVEVEYTFDGSKILFYFTADGRVDFRELVKDLASVFRTRIELRQIGVRDESKTLGSIGVCGRNLCCSQFLGEFVPVSIKMAKEQGLSLNPSKISGSCGRLMCCLKYEQDTYEDMIKESPRNGAVVSTPDGKATVINVALLKGMVKVRLDGDEVVLKDYPVSAVKPYDPNAPQTEEDFFDKEEKSLMESLEKLMEEDKPESHQKRSGRRNQNRQNKNNAEKKNKQPAKDKKEVSNIAKKPKAVKQNPGANEQNQEKGEKKDRRSVHRYKNNRKKSQNKPTPE